MEHVTIEHFDESIRDLRDDLKRHIQDLAKMVAGGFADLEKRLDVRDRVDKLDKKMLKVEEALHVQL